MLIFDVLCFALLSRDGTEFDEQKIVTESSHPVSALCALPPSDGEQLGRIAVASSSDHIIRIYRLNEEANALYQLEGHTDTGITHSVFLIVSVACLTCSGLVLHTNLFKIASYYNAFVMSYCSRLGSILFLCTDFLNFWFYYVCKMSF